MTTQIISKNCERCKLALRYRLIGVYLIKCSECSENIRVYAGFEDGKILSLNKLKLSEIYDLYSKRLVNLAVQVVSNGHKSQNKQEALLSTCSKCKVSQSESYIHTVVFRNAIVDRVYTRYRFSPCLRCETQLCESHGLVFNTGTENNCPVCMFSWSSVYCDSGIDRFCLRPDQCQKWGCNYLRA